LYSDMKKPPTGIPRYRNSTATALFQEGFRPFFLGAALWAALSMLLWLLLLSGSIALPIAIDPLAWHSHEMIYGFAMAAVAGFLLTAIPNWTGRFPLQGIPLFGLTAMWAAGRAAMATSAIVGVEPAAIIDLAFPLLFMTAVAREILTGRNWRNVPALAALALLLLGNGLTHLEFLQIAQTGSLGNRLGLAVLICLIALVGGRIIPSFTRNRLVKQRHARLPATAGALDQLALVLVPAGLAAWVADVDGWVPAATVLVAGIASAVRLARWRGILVWHDPLLFALHLGYAWLTLGLMLLGLARLGLIVPEGAALHALGAGAIATMVLAVMTRTTVSRRDCSQVIRRGVIAMLLVAHLAAALRVVATALPDAYGPLLAASGMAWIGCFGLFCMLCGPHLVGFAATRVKTQRPQ
jgi:uncharacterized protein involved in response to NO